MIWLKPLIHWGFLGVQLISAVLAISCWGRSRSFYWKFFLVVWVLTFLTEAAGKIMGNYGIHNLWLYNIFFSFFYPGVIALYADVFKKRILKWLAIAAAVLLVVWAALHLLSHNNLALNTYYTTVASSCIIFFALAYLVQVFLDKETTTPLRNDFYYWFSTGFLIYFAFTTVLLGMYTKIIESKVAWLPAFIFYTNHLITFVLHIFLWAGFRAALKWMK